MCRCHILIWIFRKKVWWYLRFGTCGEFPIVVVEKDDFLSLRRTRSEASTMRHCRILTPRNFGTLDRRIGFDLPSSSTKSMSSSSWAKVSPETPPPDESRDCTSSTSVGRVGTVKLSSTSSSPEDWSSTDFRSNWQINVRQRAHSQEDNRVLPNRHRRVTTHTAFLKAQRPFLCRVARISWTFVLKSRTKFRSLVFV